MTEMAKWIDVNEELPRKSGEYIVKLGGHEEPAFYDSSIKMWESGYDVGLLIHPTQWLKREGIMR